MGRVSTLLDEKTVLSVFYKKTADVCMVFALKVIRGGIDKQDVGSRSQEVLLVVERCKSRTRRVRNS